MSERAGIFPGREAPVAVQLLGAAPIALQEMILAVLLIWKGFAVSSPGWERVPR